MGQFNEGESYRELFLSIQKKWKQIFLDEGAKSRLRELLKIARNYPNYIVSITRRADLEINTLYFDNYSMIFTLTNNLNYIESVTFGYTLMELRMMGKFRKNPIPSSTAAAPRTQPPPSPPQPPPRPPSNAYIIHYFMVKDPTKPAKLMCKYRKKVDGDYWDDTLLLDRDSSPIKYWGDTLFYEWDPSAYVPEAIERLRKRSYELCSKIPTCNLAMLGNSKASNIRGTITFTQMDKLTDSRSHMKESWLR